MSYGVISKFYHEALKESFMNAAQKFVRDNYQVEENSPEYHQLVREQFEQINIAMTAIPVESYRFFCNFMQGNQTHAFADIDPEGPLAGITPESLIYGERNHQLIDFIENISAGRGFTIKEPKASAKWYDKIFPERRSEFAKIKKNVGRELRTRRLISALNARDAWKDKKIKARAYKSFMNGLKRSDRERYNKLTKLHKIEDKQAKRFKKLQKEVNRAKFNLLRYTSLESRINLDADQKKAMAAATEALNIAKIKLEGYKVSIQQQLTILVGEGAINDSYYDMRMAQIENENFTYHALDNFRDAVDFSQLPTRQLGREPEYYEELRAKLSQAEYSIDIVERLGIEEPSVAEKLAVYDAQLEIGNDHEALLIDRADKKYKSFMADFKKTADPKAYKLLVEAHKRDDAQNKQYNALMNATEDARREQYKCELLLANDLENEKLIRDVEASTKELRSLESTLETFKQSIQKDLDRRYDNREINSTYKIIRSHQIENGDITYRPMHEWEIAKSTSQLPLELLTAKYEKEMDTWFDAREAITFPETVANDEVAENKGTLVNFASMGIVFGPKTRNGSQLDIEIEQKEKNLNLGLDEQELDEDEIERD